MNDKTVLLIIAAFIFLTGLKSAFPDRNSELRQKAIEVISGSLDYAAAVETMGRGLSGGNLREELMEAIKSAEQTVFPALSEESGETESCIREIILNEQKAD